MNNIANNIALMDNVTLVKGILDQVCKAEDFQPLLDHLAEEVVFQVTSPDDTQENRACRGKQAVIDYFSGLESIVTFWRVEVFGTGERVVVFGEEDFVIQNSRVTARSEFALEFYIRDGWISRFHIVEDLSSLVDAGRGIITGDETRRPSLNCAPQRRWSPLFPGLPGHAAGIPS